MIATTLAKFKKQFKVEPTCNGCKMLYLAIEKMFDESMDCKHTAELKDIIECFPAYKHCSTCLVTSCFVRTMFEQVYEDVSDD